MTTVNNGEHLDMMLNMGPQHPSTHGVFRMLLRVDGEVIVDAEPHIGYLHRGSEKLAEGSSTTRWLPSSTGWTTSAT